MAIDVTADTLNQPISAQSIVKSARSNLKVPDGFAAEHILIGDDSTDSSEEPTVVGKRLALSNRARGLHTEFTFFNEGFLKVRECRKGKLAKDYMLELRFLNPRPILTKRVVMETLWAALGLGGAALVCWLIAMLSTLDFYLFPASIALASGALAALMLFIYQSGEKTLFVTATGNIPVLMTIASFGCMHRNRNIMLEISRAIGKAISANTLDEEPYLRAEMQDHYRLRDEGVITSKACTTATSRILGRFG